jgi:hypothetical protein
MDVFEVKAIGHVRGGREVPEDDNWESNSAEIELDSNQFNGEALLGLEQFSHITYDARYPRGRTDWPNVGILHSADATGQTGLASRFAGLSKFPTSLCVCRVWMPSLGPHSGYQAGDDGLSSARQH